MTNHTCKVRFPIVCILPVRTLAVERGQRIDETEYQEVPDMRMGGEGLLAREYRDCNKETRPWR
jgi:hypothetical protein